MQRGWPLCLSSSCLPSSPALLPFGGPLDALPGCAASGVVDFLTAVENSSIGIGIGIGILSVLMLIEMSLG